MSLSDLFPDRAGFRQLAEWGYPQGKPRSVKPTILAVIHITANPGDPIATAEGELAWRINDTDNQNSATAFINRDGSLWQGLLPTTQVSWANGWVRSWDTNNARIDAAARSGYNMNEWVDSTLENVGRPVDLPMTDAQIDTNAAWIAWRSKVTGITVSRETVVGHYQIDGEQRVNCPAIPEERGVIDQIIERARFILNPAAPTPTEDEVDFSLATHQIPKIVTLKSGSPLFRQPEGTALHWTVPADRKIEVELLLRVGSRFLCRRVGSGPAFWVEKAAIDITIPFRNATYAEGV